MHPDLFSIGPLTIRTYGFFVALGVITGIITAVRIGKANGFSADQILDMGFIMVLAGIIGSRLAWVAINFSHYISNPLDSLKLWHGGLVFSGGLIAAVLILALYARRKELSIWAIGDVWAPSAAIGQALGRIGCFMAGCCYGKPADIRCSVVFTNPESMATQNIPLHPVQLYSSLSGLIIFITLIILSRYRKFKGQVLIWFLILHSIGRLLLERFRGDYRGLFLAGKFTTTQFVALIILIAAFTTLFIKSGNKKAS